MPAALLVLALLGAWQAYAEWGSVDSLILPAPTEIAQSLWEDRALLWDNLLVTSQEIVFGLILALAVGLLLAVAMHMSKTLRRALGPLMVGTQAIPIPVIAPLLVVWWGFGILPKLAIVALVCFFPIAVATLHGLSTVDPDLHKLLRTLGASHWQRFRFAELPAALPAALSGAKIAVAIAAIAAVFAEEAGSSDGLGHMLMQSQGQLQTPRAWAAVTVLAAFSMLCFYALSMAERTLTPWAHRRKDEG